MAFEPAPKMDPELQAKDKRLEETVERMANGESCISSPLLAHYLVACETFTIPSIRTVNSHHSTHNMR